MYYNINIIKQSNITHIRKRNEMIHTFSKMLNNIVVFNYGKCDTNK